MDVEAVVGSEVVVVVAEDDDAMRSMVEMMLRARFDVEVVGAADGVDALRALGRVRAGMLVTDLAMPVMDGYELTAAVRADPALRSLPVVAMSANGEREHAARAAGADAFVTKPFRMDELAAAVGPHLPNGCGASR